MLLLMLLLLLPSATCTVAAPDSSLGSLLPLAKWLLCCLHLPLRVMLLLPLQQILHTILGGWLSLCCGKRLEGCQSAPCLTLLPPPPALCACLLPPALSWRLGLA
jgi:hypothetical protein